MSPRTLSTPAIPQPPWDEEGNPISDFEASIPEDVTKEAVEGYESVRILGFDNMFNRNGIQRTAAQFGYEDLAFLNRPDYSFIMQNYKELMKHYKLERGVVCSPQQ